MKKQSDENEKIIPNRWRFVIFTCLVAGVIFFIGAVYLNGVINDDNSLTDPPSPPNSRNNCLKSFTGCLLFGIPVPEPSVNIGSTKFPSTSPTSPSVSPSFSPVSPTRFPTQSPVTPTKFPTAGAMTSHPSRPPTAYPSKSPTTPRPSFHPTGFPTDFVLTNHPSRPPTGYPTTTPTEIAA